MGEEFSLQKLRISFTFLLLKRDRSTFLWEVHDLIYSTPFMRDDPSYWKLKICFTFPLLKKDIPSSWKLRICFTLHLLLRGRTFLSEVKKLFYFPLLRRGRTVRIKLISTRTSGNHKRE